MKTFSVKSYEDVASVHQSTDVIVCGFGGAGGMSVGDATFFGRRKVSVPHPPNNQTLALNIPLF